MGYLHRLIIRDSYLPRLASGRHLNMRYQFQPMRVLSSFAIWTALSLILLWKLSTIYLWGCFLESRHLVAIIIYDCYLAHLFFRLL